MTNTSSDAWRQPALCFLTFLIGIVVALAWQKFANMPGSAVSISALPVDVANAPASESWNSLLTLGVMGALALIALAAVTRLAMSAPEGRKPALRSPSTLHGQRTISQAAEDPKADVDYIREQVERQLAELVGYVSRYLETTHDQAAVFATAQNNLAGASTVEQVQEVIKLLVANNASARRNADELRARLVEAQSESAKLQANLHKAEALATVDGLTNLPNRRHFQSSLEQQVAECHREHTPLCLVMADLDHFKAVNDKFGHLSGDAVLKAFAQLLAGGVRSTDVAARYGGEEFALILPKTPLGSASVVAESLRKAVAEKSWIGATPKQRIGRVTASFGVAEIREDETVEALIDRADQKLYEAKRRGRNRVELDHTVTN